MDVKEARSLARQLMDAHGLEDWELRFNNAHTFFGKCNWSRSRIVVSRPLTEVNDRDMVTDVVLHEIAHALVGPHVEGHGIEWQTAAKTLGCKATSCAVGAVRTEPHWVGHCDSSCEKSGTHRRQRKPAEHVRLYCKVCRTDVAWVSNKNRTRS